MEEKQGRTKVHEGDKEEVEHGKVVLVLIRDDNSDWIVCFQLS